MPTNLAEYRAALDISVVELAAAARVAPSVIRAMEDSSAAAWCVDVTDRMKVFAALANKARGALPAHKQQELLSDSPYTVHSRNYQEKRQEVASYQYKRARW